jgi:tetratricopeptide (TPR) repeat protein
MSIDPWELIETQEYERAAEAYAQQIEAGDSSKAPRFNRGLALLGMRNYHAAEGVFAEIVRSNRQTPDTSSAGEYLALGVCQWCQDQPHEAIASWRSGLDAHYTDAAGGVEAPATLLYAARRLHDPAIEREALQLLRRHMASAQLGNWPGAIAPYLLGAISEQEVLMKSRRPTAPPVLIERFRCQATFYLGVHALADSSQQDDMVFRTQMRECADSWYGYLEHEYYLATWEVEHNFPVIALDSGNH